MSKWKAGDLALCIKGGYVDGPGGTSYPESGRIYTVSRVGREMFAPGKGLTALWLLDGPKNTYGGSVWPAARFIKVTPPCDMKIVEEPAKVTADDAMRAAMGMEPAKWPD